MAYDLKRTNDMNMRSSDLALGGNGLNGDVRLILLRFEMKKLLEFPGDQTPFSYLKTQNFLNFQTPLLEIFRLITNHHIILPYSCFTDLFPKLSILGPLWGYF